MLKAGGVCTQSVLHTKRRLIDGRWLYVTVVAERVG